MTAEPWVLLAQKRHERGMTQAELADGIVSQSMICQMEHGRVQPRPGVLRQLALRLGEDPTEWEDMWRAWRDASSVRSRLWQAAEARHIGELQGLLTQHASMLGPCECSFYSALVHVGQGDTQAAEEVLLRGWKLLLREDVPAMPPKLGKSTLRKSLDGQIDPSAARWNGSHPALTSALAKRLLVLDAWVRIGISMQCHRSAAVTYWQTQAEDRMRALNEPARRIY